MPIQDAVEAGFEAIGNLIDDVGEFINKIDKGGNAKETQPYGITWTKDGGGPAPTNTTATEDWGGERSIDDILALKPDAGRYSGKVDLSLDELNNLVETMKNSGDSDREGNSNEGDGSPDSSENMEVNKISVEKVDSLVDLL